MPDIVDDQTVIDHFVLQVGEDFVKRTACLVADSSACRFSWLSAIAAEAAKPRQNMAATANLTLLFTMVLLPQFDAVIWRLA
ncbi:MAG: hypothetical protein R3D34_04855 [Nitratireductor sp.]